jgi:hypothetical protein
LPDTILADPGVQNCRTGLLKNARRWNFDHRWRFVIGQFHTGCGWLCRASNGKGSRRFSAILGIDQRSHAATDSTLAPKSIRFQPDEFAGTLAQRAHIPQPRAAFGKILPSHLTTIRREPLVTSARVRLPARRQEFEIQCFFTHWMKKHGALVFAFKSRYL